MSYLLKTIVSSVLVLGSLALVSCQTPRLYHQVNNNVDGVTQTIDSWQHPGAAATRRAVPVVTKSGYYVNPTPIPLHRGPQWQTQLVSLQADGLPLNQLMKQIMPLSNFSVIYLSGVQSNMPVTLSYHGTVAGALMQVAKICGYYYTLGQNSLTWSNFETKTFNIAFMPGAISYQLGGEGQTSSQSSSGSQSAGISDSSTSGIKGNLSIWNDIKATLDKLRSQDGQVFVSEATTSVTVHDHPANIRMMGHYIDQMNTLLSQQVMIKVRVLDIDLDHQFQNGINWNLIGRALHNSWSLTGGGATALGSSVTGGLSAAGALTQLTLGGSGNSASHMIIQALQTQGKVSMVTEPQVTTMNNQVAAIRITREAVRGGVGSSNLPLVTAANADAEPSLNSNF